MVSHVRSRAFSARCAAIALALASLHVGQPADAGVRGEFDFPLEVVAVPTSSEAGEGTSHVILYEVTVPVSFRTLKGSPGEVLQLDVELMLNDEQVQLLSYEPRTSLASDVVGDIEETTTTEQSRNWGGSVGASIPIPGLKAAQIGPSANITDTGRTVRTETLQRRPKMNAVVVAGNTARGRGVFFQLRPGPDLTLEGAHHLTLRIAAPPSHRASTLQVRCRATAVEDWILFKRNTAIASSKGEMKVIFASRVAARDEVPQLRAAADGQGQNSPHRDPNGEVDPAAAAAVVAHAALYHTERPCPWCDREE